MSDDFGMMFVSPSRDRAIILDRRVLTPAPPYRIYGRTRCVQCDEWCWLGSESFKAICHDGQSPLCVQCAMQLEGKIKYIGEVKDL